MKPLLLVFLITGNAYAGGLFIRIFKQQNQLELWEKSGTQYKLYKSYPICYFSGKLGPKEREGDYQAPEGIYSISQKSLNPYSRYHLSFNVGYPNKVDRYLGRTGGLIMVHGDCVSIGCFAMTNKYIEEIYAKVKSSLKHQKKIPIHIFPFPLTRTRRFFYKWHKYNSFWEELAPIYFYFEKYKTIPQVKQLKGKYILKETK